MYKPLDQVVGEEATPLTNDPASSFRHHGDAKGRTPSSRVCRWFAFITLALSVVCGLWITWSGTLRFTQNRNPLWKYPPEETQNADISMNPKDDSPENTEHQISGSLESEEDVEVEDSAGIEDDEYLDDGAIDEEEVGLLSSMDSEDQVEAAHSDTEDDESERTDSVSDSDQDVQTQSKADAEQEMLDGSDKTKPDASELGTDESIPDAAGSDLESQLVRLFLPNRKLEEPIVACRENKTRSMKRNTLEWQVFAADCGLGYDWNNSTAKRRPRSVALFGDSFEAGNIVNLSGCLIGKGNCPWSPRCQMFQTNSAAQASKADVVVIFQNDVNLVDKLGPRRPGQTRVLYWREAFYAAPSVGTQRKFDFEMGVHWQSMILNPQFFKTPAALLGGITYPHPQVIPFLPARERPNFAMSVYSNCRPASRRNIYIQRLVEYLGSNRVHQYGRCGNLDLPRPPIQNAAKIIASYKFYLSFENTIEDGYVTEKLLHLLAMPIIPVYFGSPRLVNISTIPSFVNVGDFSHPRYLAEYLLYLDSNEEAYYEYHRWRTSPRYFNPSYLEMMAMKSPGAYEMHPFRKYRIGGSFYPRACACCRLCDENFVQWARQNREYFVQNRLSRVEIERKYFQGDFWGHPVQPITVKDRFASEQAKAIRGNI